MTIRLWTMLIIVITAAIWIIYDIYAVVAGGAVSTISLVITDWSYYSPAVPFVFGGLCVHWFMPTIRDAKKRNMTDGK